MTYNVVSLDTVRFTPCAHHEGIVGSDNGNNVNTLLLELGQFLDIAREVVYRASWRECT